MNNFLARLGFRKQAKFSNPPTAQEIELLEAALAAKFKQDDAIAFGPFNPTDAVATPPSVTNAAVLARYYEIVRVDPSTGASLVLLPRPDAVGAGAIVVKNQTSNAGNAISVRPLANDVTVDLATSVSVLGAYASATFYPDAARKNWIAVGVSSQPSTISPASFSTQQNNFNPTGWDSARYVRITIGATSFLSGAVPATSQPYKTLFLVGSGTVASPFFLKLLRQSTASSAGNRFLIPYPNDEYVITDGSIDIWYDTVSAGWRVL